jgi:cytochrome c5
MKRSTSLWIGVIVLAIVLGSVAGQAQEKEKPKHVKGSLKTVSGPLPSSLDTLYPPRANQPIFLIGMLGLDTPFSGIVADLLENAPQNAKADFDRFKAQYGEVSKLVPEWRKKFPMGPVKELEKALATQDRGKVMAAYEKVGMVCHNCHASAMPRVQQKYHWGNFDAISITDPLSKEQVAFNRLMQYLDANFAGISVSVERGDKETAQRQLQGFSARFQAMKESCTSCHDTERKYYVDENVEALIDKLGQALSGPSVDPKVVGPLIQGIGMESCAKCHWVHVPAAYAKFSSAK